ncbi:hypothetical protein DERP_010988 [Dermatophagoides pteronyssinus]|uniref:Uncharacterized protein n=1 Tax=Dermatophagoides pteronyssinus TaxID=6956 RepID=A0ABQ8JV02_DERPT|nr:hypothetical protein DERP_010988 [Dermatophagoides pteronyssinus]
MDDTGRSILRGTILISDSVGRCLSSSLSSSLIHFGSGWSMTKLYIFSYNISFIALALTTNFPFIIIIIIECKEKYA